MTPRRPKPASAELAIVPEADPERLREASALAELAPQPARWNNVLCATAGWADRGLIKSGTFYPPEASTPETRLGHYAQHFALVEVDATYYALLGADVVARWVSWTPEHFRFDVKAHPVLTRHPIDVGKLPADLRDELERSGAGARVYADKLPAEIRGEIEQRFFASLEPLAVGGRLDAVLLQFPPWFGSTRGNARHLELLVERFPGMPFAVEFRNKGWLEPDRRARVLDLLKGLQLSYVGVDEPEGKVGGLPPITEVTNPRLAIVRFHGQNSEGWNKKGASVLERFNYLYRPAELQSWAARVKQLSAQAESVHAVFNNCVRNYAVLNAKDLAVLLEREAG
ncbi:MAG TPA: DUF72 domain-containing protein [Polyangiaceae bacterium]|nr:DUF72 domain-containing protein [Polyangiaceae bacterium]